jgi:hypothetical protein
MHRHDKGPAGYGNDRDIADKVKAQFGIQGRIDCCGRVDS